MRFNSRSRKLNMDNPTIAVPAFRQGDEVILAEGTYQGTPGVFLRFDEDVRWADITERSGRIRSHPVQWLAHAENGRLPK